MKTFKHLLLIFIILNFSCEKDDTSEKKADGFSIVINNKIVIGHDDFDYYDYSSHFIYFKDENPYLEYLKQQGNFDVYADGVMIYSGLILPQGEPLNNFSGAFIQPNSYLFNDNKNVIAIRVITDMTQAGEIDADYDVRKDNRIVNALSKYNQFHSGLTYDIKSIHFQQPNVVMEIVLTNNDSFNYYYLDPTKMGINLYHNYINGLAVFDPTTLGTIGYSENFYYSNIEIESPSQWNYWDKNWLSLIKSNETKSIILSYENFDNVPAGDYLAYCIFRGLNIQLSKEELNQGDGKIWQGEIELFKKITIE